MNKKTTGTAIFLNKILEMSKNKTFIHMFLFLFTFLLLTFFTSFNFYPTSGIKAGEVNPKDITAPRNAEIINQEATQKLKIEASRKAGIIYSIDPAISAAQEEKITRFFEYIRKFQSSKKNITSGPAKTPPLNVSQDTINALIKLNKHSLDMAELISKDLLSKIMKDGVKTQNLGEAKTLVGLYLRYTNLQGTLKYPAAEVVKSAITPNITANITATKSAQQKKMEEIQPVKIAVKKGQIIVPKGEIVTPFQIEILKALNLYGPSTDLFGLIGAGLFSLLFIIILLHFIAKHCPRILLDDKLLFLLCLIIIIVVGISKLLSIFSNQVAPIAAASILIAILLDWKLAFLVTMLMSLQFGITTNSVTLTCVSLTSGIAAILSATKINRRWDLVVCGIIIIIVSCLTQVIINLMQNSGLSNLMRSEIIFGLLNGFISAMLAVALLPLFENVFNITTHIKMIELSSPNEPLLNKLLIEAPGTYHHSIIVGNLAYSAAQVVGADPLLARVGAYYHDIGKITRPYYFVENQLKNDNPHDRISPSLSTLIIMSHMKDGIELAQKAHLPEAIINFIREHHGTSLVSYFYHEALAQASEEEKGDIQEEDFRYPGSKPQSKETAIVMLADIIEASVRTLDTVNQVKISNLIKQVIKTALDDGQLDECELSFKNLKDIGASFARTLSGIYHNRIEYPDKNNLPKKEAKNTKNGKEKSES